MMVIQELNLEPVEFSTIVQCRHHWIIESAEGPLSQGVCQNCHEFKEFQNSIVEAERDY